MTYLYLYLIEYSRLYLYILFGDVEGKTSFMWFIFVIEDYNVKSICIEL